MSTSRSQLLSIGGPLFNVAMLVVLGGISAMVVYLPDRSDAGTASLDEFVREVGSEGDGSGGVTGGAGSPTDGGQASFGATPASPGTGAVGASGDELTEAVVDAVQGAVEDAVTDELGQAPIVVVERTQRLGGEPDDPVTIAAITAPAPTPRPSATPAPAVVPAAPSQPTTTIAAPPRLPQCVDYAFREQAQLVYDANRAGLRHLDGDGDGIACEQLPTSTVTAVVSCANYAHQGLAQAAFDADRTGLAVLDGDGDGVACENLPTAPPPPPPTAEEVRAITNLYAMHTLEAPFYMDEIDHIARLTGHTPGSVLFFSDFALPYPEFAVRNAYNRGMIPIVGWEPIVPGATSQPQLADIAAGEWDPFLDAWAGAARSHGVPVVIRFAAEMNGDWYPWSESRNGNSPGSFAAAWRHVRDRFEAAGADNVIWLWSVNRIDNLRTDIADYYPGDEYVDWVGMSGYLRTIPSDGVVSFDRTFGRTLSALRALTAKPILLAEIGAGTTQEAKVTWIQSLWQGLAAADDVIGFVWFNDVKSGGDWRIQTSQQVVDAFIAGLDASSWRFGANPLGIRPDQLLRVPAPSLPPTTTTTTRPPSTSTTRPPSTSTTRPPSTSSSTTSTSMTTTSTSTTTSVPVTTTTRGSRRGN